MGTLFIAFCIISIWFMFYSFLTRGSKEETTTEEPKQEFKEEKSNVFTADPVFNPHITGSGIAANPNRGIIANPSRGHNKIIIVRDDTLATQVLGKTEAEPLPKTGTSNNGWW